MNKILQVPNWQLITAAIGFVMEKIPNELIRRSGLTIYTVAIIIWAYLEIVSGVSWFRRILGLVVLLMTSYSLFHKLY